MVRKRKPAASTVETPAKKPKLSTSNVEEKTFTHTRSNGHHAVSLDESEEMFPRGGQETLTPLEKRVLHQKAKQDVLFGEGAKGESGGGGGGGTPIRGSKKKSKSTAAIPTSGKAQTKRLDMLNIKRMVPGVLVLGAILDVHEYEVLVSLPFNMRGSVAISDVSDHVTELVKSEAVKMDSDNEEEDNDTTTSALPTLERLFSVGQLMPCYVTGVEGSTRVRLSVNPSLVNAHITARDIKPGIVLPCSVKSVEDHGYIVDFGVTDKSGFLLKKNTAEFSKIYNKGKSLVIGQVMQCLILPGADARSVPVSVNPSQVNGALLTSESLIGMNALLPGMIVNAAIKEVAPNGLSMSFLGCFNGVVSTRHLPTQREFSTESYHVKKKYKARLLWVDVAGKAVGLSLQKQLVGGSSFEFSDIEIGDKFDAARVIHVDHFSALYFELSNDVIGYAPTWMITDEKDPSSTKNKEYHKGSSHTCRVIQFNKIDGLVIVSLQPSVLEKPYMKYSDVHLGEVVAGTVERVGDFGIIVALTDTIRGLCPRLHLSDVKSITTTPRRKHKEGSKVKCRVLSVEPSQKRLLLSCKKTFIRSTLEPLTDYSQAVPGTVYQGVISSVHNYGCIVRFYANVRGLVMKSELSSTQIVTDPTLHFWAGQPVECKVLRCEPEQEKLLLSLKLDATLSVEVTEVNALKPCQIISAEVTGIASNGINLRYSKTGEMVFLPTLHLSDTTCFCQPLLLVHQQNLEECLKRGKPYVLEGLLVVSDKMDYKRAMVTLKRTLVQFSSEVGFTELFHDLKVGTIQPGYVKKVMAYGCFVEFPFNLSGLAPTKYLTDEFLSSPSSVYQEMQSVWTKVLEVDHSEGRLLLSLRPSDLSLSSQQVEQNDTNQKILANFQTFLEEREIILKHALSRTQGVPGERSLASVARVFQPGRHVSGHVISVNRDCVLFELDNGVVAKADLLTGKGVPPPVKGNPLNGCMVDIDFVDCYILVSLNPNLSTITADGDEQGKAGRRRRRSKLAKDSDGLKLLSSIVGTVELKTPQYFVLSFLTPSGTRLAYGLVDSGQIGVLPAMFKFIKVGQQVLATLLTDRVADVLLPVALITGTTPSDLMSRGISSSLSAMKSGTVPGSLWDVKPGTVIDVIVQSIKPTCLVVKYHLWSGRIHYTMIRDLDPDNDVIVTSSVSKSERRQLLAMKDINVGDKLKAKVIKIKQRQILGQASKKGAAIDVLELTTKPSLVDSDVDLDNLLKRSYHDGESVTGVIENVTNRGLTVHLNPRAHGFVPIMLVSSDVKVLQNLRKYFAQGQMVRCTVVGHKKDSRTMINSLTMIGSVDSPSPGDVIFAHLKQVVANQALLVSTVHGPGRVDITDITDHYVDDPLEKFKTESCILKCCVIEMEDGRLDLSLRSSRTGEGPEETESTDEEGVVNRSCDPEIQSVEDLEKGQIVRGYVKAMTDVGAFVRLGRSMDGRVKITHLCDGFVKNFKKLYSPGKLVTAKVLNVHPVSGKVDLSLRLSHVDPEAAKKQRKEEERKKEKQRSKKASGEKSDTSDGKSEDDRGTDSSDDEVLAEAVSDSSSDEEMQTVVSSEDEESITTTPSKTGRKRKRTAKNASSRPTLDVSVGFVWDQLREGKAGAITGDHAEAGSTSESDSEEDEGDDMVHPPKKSRRQKKAAKRIEEEELYQKEHSLLETDKTPESADDFDRLLVASPNNSALWVQYMAFYLHGAEIDKARNIAQRALSTISFREEKEKLNIWVGWMNLENLYGSQETLVKVFESALQQNEPLEVFTRLVAIYEQSNKLDLADKLYQTMVKKFSNVARVWSQYGEFLMKRGRLESARNLLQRSLKSLVSKKDHVDIISKFAQMEFKHGEPERGKTIFENLVSSYPRRVDLWSVYIDMTLKLGDLQKVRDIYERVIHVKLSSKKMKFVFKRYLEFERKHGSTVTMEAVKDKAKTFVEAKREETTVS